MKIYVPVKKFPKSKEADTDYTYPHNNRYKKVEKFCTLILARDMRYPCSLKYIWHSSAIRRHIYWGLTFKMKGYRNWNIIGTRMIPQSSTLPIIIR